MAPSGAATQDDGNGDDSDPERGGHPVEFLRVVNVESADVRKARSVAVPTTVPCCRRIEHLRRASGGSTGHRTG